MYLDEVARRGNLWNKIPLPYRGGTSVSTDPYTGNYGNLTIRVSRHALDRLLPVVLLSIHHHSFYQGDRGHSLCK